MKAIAISILTRAALFLNSGKVGLDKDTAQRDYPFEGDEFLDDRIRMVEQPYVQPMEHGYPKAAPKATAMPPWLTNGNLEQESYAAREAVRTKMTGVSRLREL